MYDFRENKENKKSKEPYGFWDLLTDFRFYIAIFGLILLIVEICTK